MSALFFSFTRRASVLALAALLLATASLARAQERWAIVSALGDRMLLVSPRMQTGSNLHGNDSRPLAVAEGELDRVALRAVLGAKVAGAPDMVPVGLRDPKLYELQEGLFGSDGQALLETLRKALASAKVTHVLLLARASGEASFPVLHGSVGQGRVEGLGFYIDRYTKMKTVERGEHDEGFLGSFAYYRMVLFDLSASKVTATYEVRASQAFLLAASNKTHPWELLTAEQKIDELDRLMKLNAAKGVTELMAKRAGG